MLKKNKKKEAELKAKEEKVKAEEESRKAEAKQKLSERYFEARKKDDEKRRTLVSSVKVEEKPSIYDKEETEKKTLVKTTKKDSEGEVVSVKEVTPEVKEETKAQTLVKAEEKAEVKEEVKSEVKVEGDGEVKETEDKKVKAPKKETKKEEVSVKVLAEADPSDKTNGKYEIFHEAGGYRYRLVASNGQVLATSEAYTSAKGAQNGIGTLKANLDKLVFRVETDKHRKSQFTASTQQNKLLVQSANYSSKTQAESAEESFRNFATATKIVLILEAVESEPELVDRSLFKETQGKGKYVIVFNLQSQGYQFSLKASNGQTIITSKFYNSESSAKNAISKFKNDVKKGTFYTIKDKNGMYEFRLYNESNRLVQSGIAFDTKAKCISNIESVVRFIDSPIENK